jgi:8-hydroxy-5-deazaflavin:NADPH oxidoreductase
VRIGVLGTGMVGSTLAGKLRELDHEVRVGSRDGSKGDGTFAEAAAHGELVLNCTAGAASLQALEQAGEQNLAGKVLVDVGNPLDVSGGTVTLTVCNDDSLGEQIQRRYPSARVVKALNTVNARVMVDPGSVPGEHDVFLCGDDDGAKAQVRGLLESFGWRNVVDLGGIEGARSLEMYLLFWLRLRGATGTPFVNVHVVHGPPEG